MLIMEVRNSCNNNSNNNNSHCNSNNCNGINNINDNIKSLNK